MFPTNRINYHTPSTSIMQIDALKSDIFNSGFLNGKARRILVYDRYFLMIFRFPPSSIFSTGINWKEICIFFFFFFFFFFFKSSTVGECHPGKIEINWIISQEEEGQKLARWFGGKTASGLSEGANAFRNSRHFERRQHTHTHTKTRNPIFTSVNFSTKMPTKKNGGPFHTTTLKKAEGKEKWRKKKKKWEEKKYHHYFSSFFGPLKRK